MNKIIIIGAGGHAKSCLDVIELEGRYKIAGFIDKNESNSVDLFGYPIIGTDDDLPQLRGKYENALISVGQISSSSVRTKLFKFLIELDYQLPVIVSPRAYVSSKSKVGMGTIIMNDAMININAQIGQNCIINNKALVEHDATIGNHCHIATRATVNGDVNIGNECFIGSGTVINQSISIGNKAVIGSGVVIKTNIKSNQMIKN